MRIAHLSAAALLAALGLVGPAALAPAGATPSLLVQDAEQKKAITITGIAIGTDGQPASKLPVSVAFSKTAGVGGGNHGAGGAGDPSLLASRQDDQQGRWKVIGKGVTDASGRYTIKNVREAGSLRVEIGRKEKSDWKIETVKNDGTKDTIDMGEIKLEAKQGGGDTGSGGPGNRGGK